MKATSSWLLAALVVIAIPEAAAGIVWKDYPGLLQVGHAGIALGDFDGSGTIEAAVSGTATARYPSPRSQLLAVLAVDADGALGISEVTVLPAALAGALVAAPRQGQADRLAAVLDDGETQQIVVLGGVPLRVLRTLQAPTVRAVTAIADVDADGQPEIVAMTSIGDGSWADRYPIVLDYETGAVEWTGGMVVTDIGVAQLDADPAFELVMAGTPGRIVDGASRASDWVYPSGFAGRVLPGRFNADPNVPGFAVVGENLQVFRAQPYSPVSEFNLGGGADAPAVVRLSPAGAEQIAIGHYNSVAIYNPRNGERIIDLSDAGGDTSAIAVGDIDGDGHAELVLGAYPGSGGSLLRAVDLVTLADDYAQIEEIGPHSALARGDLAGNGGAQVVYLTFGSSAGYDGANLHVLDAASGARLRSRLNVLNSWKDEQPTIALAQLDADVQQEIIVAGGLFYNGAVVVLDSLSLDDQWRVEGYQPPLQNATVHALATSDVNSDGTPDIIVATAATRVVVLDGRNGTELWRSVTLNGDGTPSIAAFRAAAGTPLVAVARGAALYVFDLASHLLVATTKTAVPVASLLQWGEGAACRIGALDNDAVVTLYRCNDLVPQGSRLLPPDSVFFRPVDAQATRIIAASDGYLHEVAPDGTAVPVSAYLGDQLGSGNGGVLRAEPDGQHFDVVVGSNYMVARLRIGLDAIFAGGFEQP